MDTVCNKQLMAKPMTFVFKNTATGETKKAIGQFSLNSAARLLGLRVPLEAPWKAFECLHGDEVLWKNEQENTEMDTWIIATRIKQLIKHAKAADIAVKGGDSKQAWREMDALALHVDGILKELGERRA